MPLVAAKPVPRAAGVQPADLRVLALFEDFHARAVSFYLSSASFADKSHRTESITVRRLARSVVDSHLQAYPRSPELVSDLDAVLERAEQMQEGSPGFKAIFACGANKFWREFDLPIKTNLRFLQTGRHFHLAPLVRAMDSCRPYCIVLVEHGKARGFVARGAAIEEVFGFFPHEDMHSHVDDSRVGWSHRIEGAKRQNAEGYERKLSREIQRFMETEGCVDLIVGCRKDLWSEIGLYLVSSAPNVVRGEFHLPRFDLAPYEVLKVARPAFDVYRQKWLAQMLGVVHEDSGRGALGTLAVYRALQEGRVKTLLLGPDSEATIRLCTQCGYALPDAATSCTSCQSEELEAVKAQEFLVRKALLTDAEIVAVSDFTTLATGQVAAVLRY
jgi:peptide subunit release factor 1 (eRF1)